LVSCQGEALEGLIGKKFRKRLESQFLPPS